MTLGSAVDNLVFTPHLFGNRFAISDQCFAQTKKGDRCSKNGIKRVSRGIAPQWFCSSHLSAFVDSDFDDVQILSTDQCSTAYGMAKSVLNHNGAKVLLDSCESFQLSLMWRENNLLCKGRLDGLSSELKTIVDLKTCVDASPEVFSRKVADLGYHRQAAMYLRGASYHGIDVKNYVIIAVESEPPHAVALYSLTEKQRMESAFLIGNPRPSPVEYGNHQLMRLLDLYERCEATGQWPGYSEKPEPISLPKWAEMAIERE